MPRQFMNRGDRLVFSNGIVILAVLASALIVIFEANLNSLIQLYLVGVFISFTLSQAGTVVHWRRIKGPKWTHRAAINGFGAAVTGTVFLVVVTTKFLGGAWIVVAATPLIIGMMRAIALHYSAVARELAHPDRRPAERRAGNQHIVILVTSVDAAAVRAVGYVRSLRANETTAVTGDISTAAAWKRLAPEIPLTVEAGGGSLRSMVKAHLRKKREALGENDFLSLVVPELLVTRGLVEILRRPRMHRLKASLLGEPGVQVIDVPILVKEIDAAVDAAHEPARNHAVVLVAGVHNASLQAIEYAETLRPTSLQAVTFALDPDQAEKVGNAWLDNEVPIPLEIQDSPFRDIGRSLTEYVRKFEPDGIDLVVTVVVPEFRVKRLRHHVLHGQTALLVKRHLLFERGVVVVSVPYHLAA